MEREFLYTLVDSMSVSGHEIPLQKRIIAHMEPNCDEIRTDYTGNVFCILNPQSPFKVMLAAHIDEIGMIVTHIRPDGLIQAGKAGGIRPYQYPGHQVVIHGRAGKVYGVVAASKDTDKADLKVHELYIDIGAKDGADARKYVREGDPIHPNTYHQKLCNDLFSARGIDDRGCAYIILEALKRARDQGCRIGVYAVTTAGEETTMRGACWAGSAVAPDVAIAVDVTYASDYPGVDPRDSGEVRLGGGPVLCNSSIGNRKVNELLMDCARELGIPWQIESYMGRTHTDADRLHVTGRGITTALVSLPLRYMHSPSEVCSLGDVENTIALLARFLCRIGEDTDLDPFHEPGESSSYEEGDAR